MSHHTNRKGICAPDWCKARCRVAALFLLAAVLPAAGSEGRPTLPQAGSNGAAPARQAIAAGDFYNAADWQKGAISPCSMATVLAAGFGGGTVTATVGPYPAQVGGTTVAFGQILAPIAAVGAVNGQSLLSFQTPCEVTPGSQPVTIAFAAGTVTLNVAVLPASPGVYQAAGTDGTLRALAVRQDGSFVSLANPARAGDTITMLATGLGPTMPQVGTNQLPPPGVSAAVSGAVTVGYTNAKGTAGGASVNYASLTEDLIGVYEVSFNVPYDVATGNNVVFSVGVLPANGSATYYSNPAILPATSAPASNTPAVSGISEVWTYVKGVSPGVWAAISGSNLASVSEVWAPPISGALPTSLGNVSVTIDGLAAVVEYVSPTQINVLAPATIHQGQINVVVNDNGESSSPYQVLSTEFLPAIYCNAVAGSTPPAFYVTAVNPVTGEYLGNVAADPRVSRPAKAGETIDIYGIGMGPANPFTTNSEFSGAYPLTQAVSIDLGTAQIAPVFADLVAPGLYQVRFTVPANAASGDQPIQFDFGAIRSFAGVYLRVQ